jgi:catechol 2,3-dioxygenase-like lactoylglutathione lyase family enzyme
METTVTKDIYPMPAFVTLTVPDIAATTDWYATALDFVVLFTMPGPDGPSLVHLRRWRYQDILIRPGLAEPGRGWEISVAALAEELPGLAGRVRAHGGAVEGPLDTPWNTRDVRVTDPNGYRLVYTARRPEGERDERFSQMIQRLAGEQIG